MKYLELKVSIGKFESFKSNICYAYMCILRSFTTTAQLTHYRNNQWMSNHFWFNFCLTERSLTAFRGKTRLAQQVIFSECGVFLCMFVGGWCLLGIEPRALHVLGTSLKYIPSPLFSFHDWWGCFTKLSMLTFNLFSTLSVMSSSCIPPSQADCKHLKEKVVKASVCEWGLG